MTANALCTLDEARAKIDAGGRLVLAGDERLLRELPNGTWIGGTIPYFMTAEGGVHSTTRVFVTELPPEVTVASIRLYDATGLPSLPANAARNGFTMIIIPAGSETHRVYAEDAGSYPDLLVAPIVGWIAGVAMEEIGTVRPLVFDGTTGEASANAAVVLHASLPAGLVARVEMVNLFRQGGGPTITFDTSGFEVGACLVDGRAENLARWFSAHDVDWRLPLVADYCGAMINTSIQAVDVAAGIVRCFTPVFPGIQYRLASPVGDYPAAFARAITRMDLQPAFTCNCVLNYRYGELEGRRTGEMIGPITFGEIAYHLVNQTMVYLAIERG